MDSPVFKTYTFKGFLLALVANIFIIISLTQLIKAEAEKNEKIFLNAVTIANFRPDPPKPEKEFQEEEEEKEEEKKEEIAEPQQDDLFSENPDVDLDMPEFEVNSELQGSNFALPAMKVVKAAPKTNFNKLFSVDNLDHIPSLKFRKNPVYPYRAKRMGVEGEVEISFIVDKQGKVSNIKIINAKPKGIFDKSVINAVSAWEYSPGELKGKNVKTLVTTKIIFKLEE